MKRIKAQEIPNNGMQTLLIRVTKDCAFLSYDGQVFRDLKDLADGLFYMSDETFSHHVNSVRNDFSDWVRNTLKDKMLANNLASAHSRMQAAWFAATRLTFLTGKMV